MPRKTELTWQAGSNGRSGRWRKKYKGRVLYFAFGTSKSDRDGYQQAFAAWERKKDEIDATVPNEYQTEYESAIQEWSLILEWCIEHEQPVIARQAREKIEELRSRFEAPRPQPLGHDDRFAPLNRWQFPKQSSGSALNMGFIKNRGGMSARSQRGCNHACSRGSSHIWTLSGDLFIVESHWRWWYGFN